MLLCQNELRPEATHGAIQAAHAAGARTVLNLAPAGQVPDAVLGALDLLVVNEHEAATLTGRMVEPREQAAALAGRHRLTCVLTLGKEGAIAVTPDAGWRVRSLPITPVDTTGAGDTFVGVLAAWLDRGAALAEALAAATVAAGLSCEALGAQSAQPSRAQIEARLGDLLPVERL
jgi:ribokinase